MKALQTWVNKSVNTGIKKLFVATSVVIIKTVVLVFTLKYFGWRVGGYYTWHFNWLVFTDLWMKVCKTAITLSTGKIQRLEITNAFHSPQVAPNPEWFLWESERRKSQAPRRIWTRALSLSVPLLDHLSHYHCRNKLKFNSLEIEPS